MLLIASFKFKSMNDKAILGGYNANIAFDIRSDCNITLIFLTVLRIVSELTKSYYHRNLFLTWSCHQR